MELFEEVLIFSIPGAVAVSTGSALPSFKNSSPFKDPSRCLDPSPLWWVNNKLVGLFLKVKITELASNASCLSQGAIFYLQ